MHQNTLVVKKPEGIYQIVYVIAIKSIRSNAENIRRIPPYTLHVIPDYRNKFSVFIGRKYPNKNVRIVIFF